MRRTSNSGSNQSNLLNHKRARAQLLKTAVAVALSGLATRSALASENDYNPDNAATDKWSAGTNWSAGAPSSLAGDLVFGGSTNSNATVFTNGFNNTNTDDIAGVLNAYTIYFQGTGPSTAGAAANINIQSNGSSAGLAVVYGINCNANSGAGALNYNLYAPLALNTSNTVTIGGNGTANFNFYGTVTGGSNINITGSSTKTFYANTFGSTGGEVQLLAGVSRLGATNGLCNTGTALNLKGGSFDLNGFSQTINTSDGNAAVGSGNGSFVYNNAVGTTSTFTVSNTTYTATQAVFEDNTGTGGTLAFTAGKSGSGGTVLLGENELYTGVTTVLGGTLRLNNSGTSNGTGKLSTGDAVTVTAGTFDINDTTEVWGAVSNSGTITSGTQSGNITTVGSLTIGSGSSGSGSYTGTMALAISNSNGSGSTLAGSVNNTGTVTNAGAGAGVTVISGAIGSNVTSVIENSGTSALTLSGSNSFTSNTTLTAGTLNINNANALGTSAATLIINGGTIDNTAASALTVATNNAQTWGGNFSFAGTKSLNLGTGAVSLGATGTSRTVTVNASTLTVGGIISNGTTTGLTVAGNAAGMLALSAVNAYTGATSVTGGELLLTGAGAINTTSGITVNGTGAAFVTNSSAAVTPAVTLTSGAIGGSGTLNSALTIPSGSHLAPGYGLTGTSVANFTIANTLAINAGADLDYRLSTSTSSGNDLVTITGAHNVTIGNNGVVNLTAISGALTVGSVYPLIVDASGTIGAIPTGWTFNATGDTTHSYSFTEPDSHHLDLLVSTFSVPTLIYNGNTNSSFDTTSVNFYNGTSNVAFSTNSPVVFQDVKGGGSGNVTNNSLTISGTGGVQPASVTFNNSSVAYTITSSDSTNKGINGSTGITVSGAGKVTLIGSNAFTGPIALNAGTLNGTTASLDGSSTTSGITFGGGTLQAGGAIATGKAVALNAASSTIDTNGNTVALSGNLSGTGALNVTSTAGGGTLTLTGSNSYSGGSTINTGATLAAGLAPSTNSVLGTNTVTLAGGTLALQGQTVSAVTSASQNYFNNLAVTSNSTVNVSGSLAATLGTLTIGGSKLSLASSDATTGAYSLTLGATTLTGNPTYDVANSTGGGAGTLGLGALADGGSARVITINPTGTGSVTLASDASSLVQGTVINLLHGTLNSNSAAAIGTFATMNVSSPATYSLGAAQQISALNGAGAVSLGANILSLGNTDFLSSTYSGVMSGTGYLAIAAGTGTVTLSGASTDSGSSTTYNANGLHPQVSAVINSGLVIANASTVVSGSTILSGPLGTSNIVMTFGGNTGPTTNLFLGSTPGLTLANSIFLGSSGPSVAILGGLNTTGTNTFSGNVQLGTGNSGDTGHNLLVTEPNGGELDFTGNILANPTADQVHAAISFNNSSGTGTALVRLVGSNSFDGQGTVSGATVNPNVTLIAGPTASTTPLGAGSVTLAGGNLSLQGNYAPSTTTFQTTQTYSNNIYLAPAANANIDISGSLAATVGNMNVNGGTLTVTSADTSGNPYGLTAGTISQSAGNHTMGFAVFNSSGGGLGTLTVGAFDENGVTQTITKSGSGALTVSADAVSLPNGTKVNVSGGTLNSNSGQALGAFAAVNLAAGTTFSIGASQTVGGIVDTGSGANVILNGNALNIGTSNDLPTSIAGVISDGSTPGGSISKGGSNVMTLSNANTYTGGTFVAFGTLAVTNTTGSATGNGDVTLANSSNVSFVSGPVGSISGNLIAGQTSNVFPGGNGSIGSLSVGGLTTGFHTVIGFDLGSGSGIITNGDLLTLGGGTVSVAANTYLNLSSSPTTAADYRLIGGSISGITLSNFLLPTPPSGTSYTLNTSVDPGYIDLVVGSVSVGPNNLVWNNSLSTHGDGTSWANTTGVPDSAENWENVNSTPVASGFTSGDNVTFNDSNNGNYTVNLTSNVLPGSVTVSSSGTYNIGSVNGYVIGNVPAGTTTLTQSGGGILNITNVNTFTGATNVSGASTTLHLASTGTIKSGSLLVGSGSTANIDGLLTGTPAVTINGTVNLGATDTNNDPTAIILARSWGGLTIGSGGSLVIKPATTTALRTVLVATSLTNSGKIDLSNNDLVINNGNAGPVGSAGSIANQIASGFDNGHWDGAVGILSSNASSSKLFALGYGPGGGTFDGLSTASTDMLVKYTYFGDADLNGKVDGSDYSRIDSAYVIGGQTGWSNGDFNYDGIINGSDYTLIDNAFNTQGAQISSEFATATAEIAGGISGGTSSAVPEPTTLSLLAIGAAGLLGRRGRRTVVRLASC